MHTLRRLIVIACCGTTMIFAEGSIPKPGAISGKVLQKDGTPLAGATVYAMPALDMRQQIRTQTDRNGVFLLTGIPPGDVYVDAYDEEEGYPYSLFAFFAIPGSDDMKKVVVAANIATTDVIIRFADKAGRLKLDILDDHGKPILGAELSFTRPDLRGDYAMGSGAEVSMLVPPVPFRLTIKAGGFRPWHYAVNNNETPGLLSPHPGETIAVVAHLQK